jgi:hypothetical protein
LEDLVFGKQFRRWRSEGGLAQNEKESESTEKVGKIFLFFEGLMLGGKKIMLNVGKSEK